MQGRMSSNFVKDAKQLKDNALCATRYKYMCRINPAKRKIRKSIQWQQTHDEVGGRIEKTKDNTNFHISKKEVGCNKEVLQKWMVTNWDRVGNQAKDRVEDKTMSIDDFTTFNIEWKTKHCFAMDATSHSIHVFAKVSRREPTFGLASIRQIHFLWKFPKEFMDCRPNVGRG